MRHLLSLIVLSMLPATAFAGVDSEYSPLTRMEGNFESWIALAIVLTSVLTAWAINYSAPKVRVFGTVLAALGCLTVAAWFFCFVLGSGFLENPKPNQTPLDSAKPALLWIQAIVALLSGLFLLFIAKSQSKRNDLVNLNATNEEERYGMVSRLLHWTIAILILALIPMGIFTSIIAKGTEYRDAYYIVHKTIGVVVILLVIARLIWNQVSKRPALDESLTPRERKLAHGAHITLYFMMIAMPVTGFIMTTLHNKATYFFFWEIAPSFGPSELYVLWGAMHKYLLPYLLYIILGAHILAALKHQFIDKSDKVLKRIVS